MMKLKSLIPLTIGLSIGLMIILFSGVSLSDFWLTLKEDVLTSSTAWQYIITRSCPIILTGLSVLIALSSGNFNIGVEGQFILGTIVANIVGASVNFPFYIQIPFIICIAMLSSGLVGLLISFLKIKYKIHEVISSIMFNWSILYLNNFIVMESPLHRADSESLQSIVESSNLKYGILISIFSLCTWWILYSKSKWGFQIKILGKNNIAAQFWGFNTNRLSYSTWFISAAIAGLAGAIQVMSVSKSVSVLAMFEGYGFDGLAVTLMGQSHPAGLLLSAGFISFLKYLGIKLQSGYSMPSEAWGLVIGVIMLLISIPIFKRNE